MKIEVPAEGVPSGRAESGAATVLRLANERGDFVQGEDGYTYYWPTNQASHGCLPAWALRVLADEMDRRDRGWDAIINGDPRIGPGCVQVWKWENAPEEFKKLHVADGDEDWLALVPKALLASGEHDTVEVWWMRWYRRSEGFAKRYTERSPEGFEIWVGSHA